MTVRLPAEGEVPANASAALTRQPSLSEQVREWLRAGLITGELSPGTTYSAPSIARLFGVSATPVREALLDLVSEGLFEIAPNKGFTVRRITEVELDELTAVRRMLEVPTIGEVARSWDNSFSGKRHALRATAQELARLAERGDLLEYVRLDQQFHSALLNLTGNATLVRQVEQLRARSRLFGLGHLAASGQLVTSAQEHEEIVEAIFARDAERAMHLMSVHIDHVRQDWARPAPAEKSVPVAGEGVSLR